MYISVIFGATFLRSQVIYAEEFSLDNKFKINMEQAYERFFSLPKNIESIDSYRQISWPKVVDADYDDEKKKISSFVITKIFSKNKFYNIGRFRTSKKL